MKNSTLILAEFVALCSSLRNRIRGKKLFVPFHSSLMSDEPRFSSERNGKLDCICTEKFLFQQNDYGMYGNVFSNIVSNNMNRENREMNV